LFENLSVSSLKGALSNATTFKLPLFSLDNTFNPYILSPRKTSKTKKEREEDVIDVQAKILENE
jgi:hypothetical protein